MFTYSCYKNNFKTIPEVINHMQELQQELANTNLQNLQYFNQTYIIISTNVYAKIGTGCFSDDAFMKDFDINFARYYFSALKNYVDGKKMIPAWKVTFDFCKANNSMPLIYLIQAANAHVNNDLPLVLFESIKSPTFKSDYDKVDPIITKSANEITTTLHLNPFYNLFIKIYITRWRKKAWNNYYRLSKNLTTKPSIKNSSYTTALDLAKINNKRDFYHLLKLPI